MITQENGFALSDNIKYRYFETSMDYLQKAINKFKFREGRAKKQETVPFMSMVTQPIGNIQQGYYYTQKDKIISVIRRAKEETRLLYTGYDNLPKEDRNAVRAKAWEIKQGCIEEIENMSSSPLTMYLVLREIDNPEYRDVSRYIFDVLFGRPDQAFFMMIKESKEPVYTLKEDPTGDIFLYDFSFTKVPLAEK